MKFGKNRSSAERVLLIEDNELVAKILSKIVQAVEPEAAQCLAGRGMAKFKVGKNVAWKWPPGYVTGVVQEIYLESVSCEIKGKKVIRHGTSENPAYLLLTKKAVNVLKLESELFDHEQGPTRKEES